MSCLFNTLSKFIDIDSASLRHNICNYLQNNPKLYEDMRAEDAILWSNEGYENLNDYNFHCQILKHIGNSAHTK